MTNDSRPLVAHVVYRFDTGGLENGVVNLVNRMSAYRHAVIALTEVTSFRERVERDDVRFVSLRKLPGHGARLYPRLVRLFRDLRPAIVHTRNLGALEIAVPAWFAGVPARVHGEHGWDVGDFDGSSVKYRWVRRLYRPFVSRYIALSRDLERYLSEKVGVPRGRIAQIYNGVDTARFRPAGERRVPIEGCPFTDPAAWLVGTVGRMQTVKDQTNLAQAFVRALQRVPALAAQLRLVMIGDGPLREEALAVLETAGVAHLAWLPGVRDDVPQILRGLDCFVLPSLAEGISNTILEAMASGLPVIATDVGGNRELVVPGVTGALVPAADSDALAQAIAGYASDPAAARAAGRAGRARAERSFGLEAMVASYQAVYDKLLAASGAAAAPGGLRPSA
jgi:sugar transferase (PEP-CTERM/EpsH1 system associated)